MDRGPPNKAGPPAHRDLGAAHACAGPLLAGVYPPGRACGPSRASRRLQSAWRAGASLQFDADSPSRADLPNARLVTSCVPRHLRANGEQTVDKRITTLAPSAYLDRGRAQTVSALLESAPAVSALSWLHAGRASHRRVSRATRSEGAAPISTVLRGDPSRLSRGRSQVRRFIGSCVHALTW
jgi:hypothetical protein